MTKINVAIIGVGNCASSLVQGVYYYRSADERARVPGLMHVSLGGYHVADIEFAAFDRSNSSCWPWAGSKNAGLPGRISSPRRPPYSASYWMNRRE